MRRTILILSVLFLGLGTLLLFSQRARADRTGEPPFPPEWMTCRADTDCVVVTGVCGEWDCVIPKFAKELDQLNKKMVKEYGCVGADPQKPKPTAVCTPKGCRCKAPAAKAPGSKW